MSAGSAGAFNCYLDRDIDRAMQRTQNRPLVTGELTDREALVFAWTLGVGIHRLALASSPTGSPRRSRLAAILFYVVIYTLILKRRTAQNIVWGGDRRLLARAHRLGGRHRLARLDAVHPVRASSSSGRRRTTGRCR